jgi:hypothetical protein
MNQNQHDAVRDTLIIARDEIRGLEKRIKRLEKDSERLAWLLQTGLAWRGCYNEYWIEGEWLYASESAIEIIDKAKEAKP